MTIYFSMSMVILLIRYVVKTVLKILLMLVLWKELIFFLHIPLFIKFHLYYLFSSVAWFGNLRSQAPPLEIDCWLAGLKGRYLVTERIHKTRGLGFWGIAVHSVPYLTGPSLSAPCFQFRGWNGLKYPLIHVLPPGRQDWESMSLFYRWASWSPEVMWLV